MQINQLSMDVETNIIGSALALPKKSMPHLLHVKPLWFHIPVHQRVWEYLLKACAKSPDFSADDFIYHFDQVQQVHDDLGVLKETTLAQYLAGLRDNAIGVFDSGPAEGLFSLYRKRSIREGLQKSIDALDQCEIGEDVYSVAQQAMQSLESGVAQAGGNIFRTAQEVIEDIARDMENKAERWSTGLECLDDMLGGGLFAGKLYGLGGAEKSGKTTLAMTISRNLNRNGCKHAYLCFEADSKDLMMKVVAAERQFNSLDFLKANTDEERGRCAELAMEAAGTIPDNVLFADMHKHGLSDWDDVRMVLHRLQSREDVKGVIIDYWQLIGGAKGRDTEEKHLRTVADSLAKWTRMSGKWVVLLAQLNQHNGLFGGNGLRKACDALTFIQRMGEDFSLMWPSAERQRWLKCEAIRYALRNDAGNEENPAIELDTKAGPLFRQVQG